MNGLTSQYSEMLMSPHRHAVEGPILMGFSQEWWIQLCKQTWATTH